MSDYSHWNFSTIQFLPVFWDKGELCECGHVLSFTLHLSQFWPFKNFHIWEWDRPFISWKEISEWLFCAVHYHWFILVSTGFQQCSPGHLKRLLFGAILLYSLILQLSGKKVNAIIFSLENAVPSNWSQCIKFVYFLSEDFEICRFHAALNNRTLKSKLFYQTEFSFSVHLIFNYGQRLLISCRLKAGG